MIRHIIRSYLCKIESMFMEIIQKSMRSSALRSRNTSKSYKSTSPSYNIISPKSSMSKLPSAQIQQSTHFATSKCIQSSTFISDNQTVLANLKHLLVNEEVIAEQYREWCQQMSNRVSSHFHFLKSTVANLLEEEERSLRQAVEKDYRDFLAAVQLLKNRTREVFRQKIQYEKYYESQKQIGNKLKQMEKMNEYYGSPSPIDGKLVGCLERENEERQGLRELNCFYEEHQRQLEDLNDKVVGFLQYRSRLSRRQVQIQEVFSSFTSNLKHSITTLHGYCLNLMTY